MKAMIKHLLTVLALAPLATSCAPTAPVSSAPLANAEVTPPRIVQSGPFRPSSIDGTRIKGVRHIGKTVSDIDATIAFYNGIIPFELVKRYRIPASELFPAELMESKHGKIDVAVIRTPTVFLKLIDFEPNNPTKPYVKPVYGPGYTHICFQSPATDPALSKFTERGLEMVSRNAPVDLGGYGVTYAYGLDPDGTMIENETVDRPRRSDPAWITHIGGATSDAERMADYYTKFIGYGPRRMGEYSNFPRIDDVAGIDGLVLRSKWFVVQNLEIEFWEYVVPVTPVRGEPADVDQIGYNMTAFEVTDADAEVARLKSEGIEVVGPAKVSQGWKIYYTYDPDGNVISIQENISAAESESIDDLQWIDPTTF